MKIKDLMTRDIISLAPDEELFSHLNIFREHRIHHIPVVDRSKQVVGMLSSKDFENIEIIFKLLNKMKPSETVVRIADVMTSPIFSYFEDVEVASAAEAMVDNNIHAIVVVDKNEKMIGILTSTDLLRYIATSGKNRPV